VFRRLPALLFREGRTVGAAPPDRRCGQATAFLANLRAGRSLAHVFGHYLPYRMSLAAAQTEEERRHIKSFFGTATAASLCCPPSSCGALFLAPRRISQTGFLLNLSRFGLFAWSLLICFHRLAPHSGFRKQRATLLRSCAEYNAFPSRAYEYRSRTKFWAALVLSARRRFSSLRRR